MTGVAGGADSDTFADKTARNCRVQGRYDELMREGKHGHYETMFRVVREEVESDRARRQGALTGLREQLIAYRNGAIFDFAPNDLLVKAHAANLDLWIAALSLKGAED